MSSSSQLSAEIAATNENFVARFAAGDAAGVAALYTDDGAFLAPNAEPIRGRAAIGDFLGSLMAQGIAKVQLATDDVEGEGDTAWECGRYVLETADGQVADRGKFLVIWKRVDGNWHLHRDMINTNLPAEGA